MKQLIIEKNSGQILEIFSETAIITESQDSFTDGEVYVYKMNYETMTLMELEVINFEEGDEYIEKYTYAIVDGKIVIFDSVTYKLNIIRTERNKLLKESDWTQLGDLPFNDNQKHEWKQYRQTLRDLPLYCNINKPIYPIKPS